MPILCSADRRVAKALTPVLDGTITRVDNLAEAALSLVADPCEDLVLIGRGVPVPDVLDFASHVRGERPATSLILLRDGITDSELVAAHAAGVRAVVPAGETLLIANACREARASGTVVETAESKTHRRQRGARSTATEAVESSAETAAASERASHVVSENQPETVAVAAPQNVSDPRPKGKIVTVFSPKGGAGKTTISTNLAVALHANGARRVCLIDLDVDFGDVGITLRLQPSITLVDGLNLESYEDPTTALVTAYRPGFDCVLAPIEPGEGDRIPAAMVSALLDRLRDVYDYVVVDTPSRFSEHVLAALDLSDHHVLVTNPEIPALKSLRLTLDMMDLLGYPHDRRTIVYNKADPSAGLADSEVASVLHAPIATDVPASRDVPASINAGVPLMESRPDHQVSAAIRAFATGYLAPAADTAGQTQARKGRLFTRGKK